MKSFYEFYLQVQKEAAVGPDPAPAAGAGESLMAMQIWDQLPTDIKNGLYTLPDEQLLKMNIPQAWRSQWPTVIKMAKESPAGQQAQQAQQAQLKTYYDSLDNEYKKKLLNPETIKEIKQASPPVAAPTIDALAKLAQADPNLMTPAAQSAAPAGSKRADRETLNDVMYAIKHFGTKFANKPNIVYSRLTPEYQQLLANDYNSAALQNMDSNYAPIIQRMARYAKEAYSQATPDTQPPQQQPPQQQAPQQQAPQQQAPQQQPPQKNSFFNRAANMFGFGRK